jgi:hypothetical protein
MKLGGSGCLSGLLVLAVVAVLVGFIWLMGGLAWLVG